MNFLEELISEWYEYKGYFVRQNVRVGKRAAGSYDGELDIVAFHPETKHLLHIETSADANSWEKRETQYKKKFDVGRKFIHSLFKGLDLPSEIDQQAIFQSGKKRKGKIGGGQVYMLSDYFKIMKDELSVKSTHKEVVPENLILIRTLHLFISHNKM